MGEGARATGARQAALGGVTVYHPRQRAALTDNIGVRALDLGRFLSLFRHIAGITQGDIEHALCPLVQTPRASGVPFGHFVRS
jgi:hypothetical protein